MLCGNARKRYWRMPKVKWVAIAMPERYFIDKGEIQVEAPQGSEYQSGAQGRSNS
ncbi:hypothetical protein [uncultured Desulfobacter sp.]|uniref:hypothetical protein n=1 Tax=uncultured Desulfobacter sp. TaxID=240139 RepID=UPI0029F4712B|nr:hypothetical protein [uncultured Desulfobacter sp.]